MGRFESEGARHSAAARIEHDDLVHVLGEIEDDGDVEASVA